MTIDTKYVALSGLLSWGCPLYKGQYPLQSDVALSGLIDNTALKGYNILTKGAALRKSKARSQALKGRNNIE